MRDQIRSLRNSAEFAEERLVASAQSLLQELLNEKGINRSDLASRMGVSKARVSQLFSDDQNFTFRLIAKAFHALGENLHLSRASQVSEAKHVDLPPGGGVSFEATRREVSHGFEWLDRDIPSGGQHISREPSLSLNDVAKLMKEFMSTSPDHAPVSHEGHQQHQGRSSSDWSRSSDGSNVIKILRKRAS